VGRAARLTLSNASAPSFEHPPPNTHARTFTPTPTHTHTHTNTAGAQVYFIVFTLLLFVIFLNIVIGVVVEAMAMAQDPPEVPTANLKQYLREWGRLDPLGRGFLDSQQVGGTPRARQACCTGRFWGRAGPWEPIMPVAPTALVLNPSL
jgi:hypothetical protein